jgi:uncharacterized protein (DUF302 family)
MEAMASKALVHRLRPWSRSLPLPWQSRRPAAAIGASAIGSLALGALSLGALAVGALAIGRLAVRAMRIRDLRIGTLAVGAIAEGSVQEHAGIVDRISHHPIQETVERVQALLRDKGIRLFALVDHSGEAKNVGLEMRPTKLLIFGSPKAGTPLMVASPGVALDLPLKLLVWQAADGTVHISYNSVAYLQERHGLSRELAETLAIVDTLAEKAAE